MGYENPHERTSGIADMVIVRLCAVGQESDLRSSNIPARFRRAALSILWILMFLTTGTLGRISLAEAQQRSFSLSGLDKEEVLRRVGEPDSRVVSQDQITETWHYGDSIVSFVDGKVLMWSDPEGLAKRSLRRKVSKETSADVGDPRWLNPWTPQKLRAEDVIQDLE